MCGITAMVAPMPRSVDAVRRMTDLVRHRGPDDEGYLIVPEAGAAVEVFGGPSTPDSAFMSYVAFAPNGRLAQSPTASATVAFGHRRLSILDLSAHGHQPMCTPDRRYWIVYNGEIYNYRELGEELARLGHRFVSHCDTEVILAAIAQWGDAGLHRLNGMFAFVMYDSVAGEIVAARDRFGIKPLYYWAAPDATLYFASEIKQFTAAPGWRAVANPARAASFLATGLTDDRDETMFDRVFHIGPGECVRFPVSRVLIAADGRIPVRRWYHLNRVRFSGSYDDAVRECRRLLEDSVRLMLRADVPIGSCLSGGIDSSSIVCLIGRELERQGAIPRQQTFSARSDSPAIDEQRWIDEVVSASRVESHVVLPTVEDLVDTLPALTWHQDEPCTSTSVFAQWSVFALAARAGVKVMLDGQGADEAFAGYHSFLWAYVASLARKGRVVAAWRELRAINHRHRTGMAFALRGAGAALKPAADPNLASVSTLSRAQLMHANLQMLLRFEDRNSMAHSVEARVPFLDHRLVEFAVSLPDDFKISRGVTKRVLRAAISNIVPDRIRERVDKIGFETPEAQWLRGPRSPWFRAQLEQAIDISDGLLPASSLRDFDAMIAGTKPFSRQPWRAISFGQWTRAFAAAAPTRAQ